jgi:hypothetical protein
MNFFLSVSVCFVFSMVNFGALQTPKPDLQSLGWLGGCWEFKTQAVHHQEQWLSPAGGTMIGMGRMVKNGKLAFFEFMELRQDGPNLVFTAHPSGQKTTTFQVTAASATEATFENPDHDFPQKIEYRLTKPDFLEVTVSGLVKGKNRVERFQFTRVSCPAR